MRKQFLRLLAFSLLLPCSLTLAAEPMQPAAGSEIPSFIPVMTRLVKVFLELEAELDQALRQGDSARVDELVRDDFEQRIGSRPGTPIPRQDWLEEYAKQGKNLPALTISQMAARELGDIIVVSFKWAERNKAGLFIVDVWKRNGEGWLLLARYADPEAQSKLSVPGAPLERKEFPKKF